MILRVRGRDSFQRFTRDGRRVRRAALWCTWCPDSSSTTSVAFALGRALGPAVVRNRLRRRLRAVCRQLEVEGRLPPGSLLFGANQRAVELTYAQIEQEVRALVSQLNTGAGIPTSGTSPSDGSKA